MGNVKKVVLRRSSAGDRSEGRNVIVNYRECQRNHAANTGGYALDGCTDSIPGGHEGTDLALFCATCGCHRNFHRREVDTEVVGDSSNASSSCA